MLRSHGRIGLKDEASAGLGVTKAQVSRLEMGLNWPRAEVLVGLARCLSVSADCVLGLDAARQGPDAYPQAVIRSDYRVSAGLRQMAGKGAVIGLLQPIREEWAGLLALPQAWPDGSAVAADGWVAILYPMRGAATAPASHRA